MIQDNSIEGLENAAKKFLKKKDEESNTMWTEDDEEIIKAFCDFSKEQYKDLIQSHAELLNALTKLIFVVECNRATNGVSLEIMYQTEHSLSKSAIEKANSIINQQK